MNVLVTGAGGPAAINVIKELVGRGHVVIAVDCDPTAAGFHLAQRTEVIPRSDHPEFVETLLRLLAAHDAKAIVSTIVEELMVLDETRERLAHLGVGHWGPSRRSLTICADKQTFADTLSRCGVATPETGSRRWSHVRGPWIVKPRNGRGSRDVHAVDTRRDVRAARRLTPDPIVQTRLNGREFSVDALISTEHVVLGSAARWRDACRGGISTSGTTFCNPTVDDMVQQAISAVGLTGPANVQGFVNDAGEVAIVEINPRFSGALCHSLAAGCDLVGQHLEGALGNVVDVTRLVARPGVTMTRTFDEIYTGIDESLAVAL